MNRGRFGRVQAPTLPDLPPSGHAAADRLLSQAQRHLRALPGDHDGSVERVGTYRLAICLTGHLPIGTARASLGEPPSAGER